MKKKCLLIILVLSVFCLHAQDTINKKRLIPTSITYGVAGVGSIVGLGSIWYADYPQSDFHWFNDNDEWLQMDKFGHAISSYHITRLGSEIFEWTGLNSHFSSLLSSGISFTYMLGIEILDGTSTNWGASWGDLIANTSGIGLFLAQDLIWQEQRILLKYSFIPTDYADLRPAVLGSNLVEQMLKDYNGQTCWLSFNLESFFEDDTFLPAWLNVAVGIGADGMTGGSYNPMYSESGALLPHFDRQRQFYLSLDVDFSRISTNSKFLRSVFNVLNVVKVPFPALEYGTVDGIDFRWLQF